MRKIICQFQMLILTSAYINYKLYTAIENILERKSIKIF